VCVVCVCVCVCWMSIWVPSNPGFRCQGFGDLTLSLKMLSVQHFPECITASVAEN
jgi:hypothetical protein